MSIPNARTLLHVAPNIAFERQPWVSRAACTGHYWDGAHPHDIRNQKEICRNCPVQTECLAYALQVEAGTPQGERHLVWGGLTPQERHRLTQQEGPITL